MRLIDMMARLIFGHRHTHGSQKFHEWNRTLAG